jgi:hypothetical protein
MEVNETRLNIEKSILKEEIVEDLLRETADPIPFGPGHLQGTTIWVTMLPVANNIPSLQREARSTLNYNLSLNPLIIMP